MFRLNTEVAAVYKEMNSLEAGNKWSPRQKSVYWHLNDNKTHICLYCNDFGTPIGMSREVSFNDEFTALLVGRGHHAAWVGKVRNFEEHKKPLWDP